jgi:NADPH-dependent 2,4-dienoyl-CoA reductase/sulfur reductase-like enzyme
MSNSASEFDVLIIGAGPGGIAAAVTAAQAGSRVGLIDEAPFAGGQIWRNLGRNIGSAQAKQWLDRLAAVEGKITWHRQSRIVASPAASTLLAETPAGVLRLKYKSLILATGARELFLPFPGWTLPGVMGAGAIQALVKQGLNVAGKRIVVAGTGPLLLAVADLLRAKGASVPCIIEQAPAARINRFALSLVRSPSKLLAGVTLRARLLGTRYATDRYPIRVTAGASGLRVEYRTGGQSGQKTDAVECDYFTCGFNLIPNNELPRMLGCQTTANGFVRVDGRLRTTVPHIFAIGELTAIGGVDKAILEGSLAADAAVGDESAAAELERDHTAALNFAHNLEKAFALRPELLKLARPETIICRCEDVPLSAVQRSMSGRDAKLQTRCGMGPCQGRVCGPILQQLLGTEPPQIRPPVLAARIGTLIEEHI